MGRTSQSIKFGLLRSLEQAGSPTTQTQKQYKAQISKFADFCKEMGVTQLKHASGREKELVQGYADRLQELGYSPASIHTYLASPCKALAVPMGEIKKPLRSADMIRRSRHIAGENERGAREERLEKFERIVSFAEAVGIRRAEYAALKGNCLVRDESGSLCVLVEQGKGGKMQLQRILPDYEKTVLQTLRGIKSDEYVFSKQELANDIDLHKKRSENAQRAYHYYRANYRTSEQRDQLRSELLARWDAYHRPDERQRAKFIRAMREGDYITRGTVRDVAEANGHGGRFDRLCVMAVSVFHLSHWRAEVTITNYLINDYHN